MWGSGTKWKQVNCESQNQAQHTVSLLETNRGQTLGSWHFRYFYISQKPVHGSLFLKRIFFFLTLKHRPKLLSYSKKSNKLFRLRDQHRSVYQKFRFWSFQMLDSLVELACIPQKPKVKFVLSPRWLMFRDVLTYSWRSSQAQGQGHHNCKKELESNNIPARPSLSFSLSSSHIALLSLFSIKRVISSLYFLHTLAGPMYKSWYFLQNGILNIRQN